MSKARLRGEATAAVWAAFGGVCLILDFPCVCAPGDGMAMSRLRFDRTSNRAFTLVELLVVISIIALLLAMLLPHLNAARRDAMRVKCLAHVRAVAQGSLTYAAEDSQESSIPAAVDQNDPFFDVDPHWAQYGNYGFGGKSGRGGPDGDVGLSSPYGWNNGLGSIHRPLNLTLYKTLYVKPGVDLVETFSGSDMGLDLPLYRCPADDGYQGNHYRSWARTSLTSYDFFGTSYAANVFWTGPNVPTCTMGSNSPYLRPLSRVPHPARTFLYVENVGRYSWNHKDPAATKYGGPFPDILPDPEYPEVLGGPQWHGKGWHFNTGFADGHADPVKIQSYVAVDPYPSDLTGKCAEPGLCKWILIRGRQWQLDCLPSAPIETRHPCPPTGRPSQDGNDIAGWLQ